MRTVGRDTEAYDHWLAQGVERERIYEFGAKENFWPWAIPALADHAAKFITIWGRPRQTRATPIAFLAANVAATSKFGILSSCNSIGMPTAI